MLMLTLISGGAGGGGRATGQISDCGSKLSFNICKCETSGYFNGTSGQFPAMSVATKPCAFNETLGHFLQCFLASKTDM